MSLPDLGLEASMALLTPYLPILAGAVQRGFTTYQERYPDDVRADHDASASAKNVHRHILTELSLAIADKTGLAMINARGLEVVNIRDQAVLRFKKMDEEGRSNSYQTQQQRDFDRQLTLPGLPISAVRLTFGYEPDLAFSTINRILVACPLGSRSTLWCVQVDAPTGGAATWADITPRRIPGTEGYRRYGSHGA